MPSPIPGTNGAAETRPREGLRPKSPQQEAGIRIEPPPSEPCAIPHSPAATAAARRRSSRPRSGPGPMACGRAVQRRLGDRRRAELGRVRLPEHDEAGRPEPRDVREVEVGTFAANACEENVVRIPAVVSRSLSEIGTPWNGASAGSSAFARASASASLAADRHEGAQLGVQPLDPLEVELDQLDRRDLALPDEPACSVAGRKASSIPATVSGRAQIQSKVSWRNGTRK